MLDRYFALRCSSNPDAAGTQGRLRKPELETRRVASGVAAGSQHDVPATRYLSKVAQLQRRVLEILAKRCHATLPHQMECQKLWQCVCRDGPRLFDDAWAFWWHIPNPTNDELHLLSEAIDTYHRRVAIDAADSRAMAFRKQIRKGWSTGGRSAFEAVKEPRDPPIRAIKCDDVVKTDVAEILHELSHMWGSLWNKPRLQSWEAFRHRYHRYFTSHACNLPELTGAMLARYLKTRPAHRAVAACGTRMHEMQDLPVCLLDIPAAFLMDIENGDGWPSVLEFGIVSCLPKGAGDAAQDEMPLNVLAPKAADTRPITNLSPWKTLYSGLRYQHMNAWREQWLPHNMHGARSGHEVYDVSYELALLIEQHQRKGEPFGVISMDRRKFFDLLEWDIGNNLMLAFGCDPKVVNAESRFMHNLTSRFKVGQAVSTPSSRINGYVQGDSWSVQVALAVMAVWSKTMMEAHVHTSGFLDDSNFRANNLEQQDDEISDQPAKHLWVRRILKGMQLSTEFDRLSGCQTNMHKTKALVNHHSLQKIMREALSTDFSDLEVVTDFILVGSQISVRRSSAAKYLGTKVAKAIATCHSIGRLPLPCDARLLILGSKSVPRVCFGSELMAPTQYMLKSLSSAHMFALFGHACSFRHVGATMVLLTHGPRVDPSQAVFFDPLQLLRRILLRRPALRELFQDVWQLRQRGENRWVSGNAPTHRIQQIAWALEMDWSHNPFEFHRAAAPPFPLLAQQNDWWRHELRNMVRQHRWKVAVRTKGKKDTVWRNSFDGSEHGVNIHATTALLRAKTKRTAQELAEAVAEDMNHEAFLQLRVIGLRRALLRQMLTDAIFTWRRRWRKKRVSSPTCPFCDQAVDETIQHIHWECPRWAPQRQQYLSKYPIPLIPCEACCGILPELPELEGLAMPQSHETLDPPCPNPADFDMQAHFVNGKMWVGSDGACPNQQGEQRLRRSGCGLFYGDGHPCNASWPSDTYSQSAARAEVRAALRWLRWAWCPQELLTDNAAVVEGFTNLATKGQHGMHSHLDLWETIQTFWHEKGSILHLVVRKVKGHRTAAECHGDPMLLLEKRLNDGADRLAVAAAEGHQVPAALQASYHGECKRIWLLQQTLLNIHMARETVIRQQGIRKLDGIHNSTNTEAAPTPAPQVSQLEVPQQLGDLDGDEEQARAMFPRYTWDPLPYDHFKHFRGNIPLAAGTLAKDTPGLLKAWTWYPPALFDPLLWYWRQLEWPSMPRATNPSETVTWLELAIDFQASTHVELGRPGGPCTELTAGKRAIFFASASRKLAVICKDTLAPVAPFPNNLARGLTALGLPPAGGFPMRPKFLLPKVVHAVLLQAAQLNLTDTTRLDFIPQFGSLGKPLWNPDFLPLEEPRRRVRGKQRASAFTPAEPPRAVVERTRDDFPWDPGLPYYIPDLTTTQIRRERNRLLHNYDADARFRHRIAPFYGAHGKGDLFLFCEKCHLQAPWKAWSRKWPENRCGGSCEDSGPAPSQELNANTLNWRIRRVDAHNELADVNSLHLIAQPNRHDSRIRCIRPGCGQHLSWCQSRSFFAMPCLKAPR